MRLGCKKVATGFITCVLSKWRTQKEIVIYILLLSDPDHFQGIFEAFNVRTHLGSDASPVSMVVFPSVSLSQFVHAQP